MGKGINYYKKKDKLVFELSNEVFDTFEKNFISTCCRKNGIYDIEIDFKNIKFMTSYGLALLLKLRREFIKENITIQVNNLNKNVNRIFNLVNMQNFIVYIDNDDDSDFEVR